MTTHPLYAAALAADEAFHSELVRVYGRKACDARYDRKRNAATPALARLGAAKEAADAAWIAALRSHAAVTP